MLKQSYRGRVMWFFCGLFAVIYFEHMSLDFLAFFFFTLCVGFSCNFMPSIKLAPSLTLSVELLGRLLLSGVPDYFGRNKISSGGDLSHYSSASLY